MTKIILSMFLSLDGYIEAPGRQLAPPADTPDLRRYWIAEHLNNGGTLLYGRTCYTFMAGFWMSPDAPQGEARKLASLPKVVFSRTLQEAAWANTTIARDPVAEVARIKAAGGKDALLFGGAGIARSFMAHRLFDEYRLMVTPTILGGGTPLFEGGHARFDLTLLDTVRLDNGAVILHYRDERKP